MASGVGRDLRVYSTFSFKGGLDIRSTPLDLVSRNPIDTVRLAKNMVMTAAGGMTKRYDVAAKLTTSVGSTVAITGGIHFRKSDGTAYVLVGSDDGRLIQVNSDATSTNIKTGLTAGTQWSFAIYNDKLIAANGADPPRKWDGTTEAALGGTPPTTARVVAVHGNRVMFTETTAKSKLTWSALNDEEDYVTASNAGSLFVAANDGSDLIGLVPAIEDLILLKGARPYRLQGNSPSTFALTNVVLSSGSVGAESPAGNMFALNDIHYLSRNGIMSLKPTQAFGDLYELNLSHKISPYFQPTTDFTLSLANLAKAVSVYDRNNQRLMWAVDTDGDAKNDLILVYDLLIKGWTTWTGISAASLFLVRNSTTGVDEVWFGGYDGKVYAANVSASTNTIEGEIRHLTHLGLPGVVKSPRHMFLYFDPKGATSCTLTTIFDLSLSGGQTYTVDLTTGGGKQLGIDWLMATDVMGRPTQVISRVDLSGIGEFVEFRIANSAAGAPFTLLGYQVFWRPRRVIRR